MGLGSAVATPFATEIVLFSFPTLFAIIGGAHQDYRYRRSSGGLLTQEVEAKTSHIPFGAFIKGKQSWTDLANEFKISNALIAIFIAAAFH